MDKRFMKRALKLARSGLGKVSPNPLVGAVIVKDNIVIGEGFHQFYGDKHAEVNAINSCTTSPKNSTLYCNLEPCSKSYLGKKNSPCCNAIIASGITKVFISQLDPNPNVSGSGVKILRDAGIEVLVGLENKDALELNSGFNTLMLKNRPYVHLKWAQTLDGQIATSNGVSKWISSETCRKETHSYRAKYDGILVGRNTLVSDNPTLDSRYGFNPSPRPVIIDSSLKSDPNLNVFKRNPIIICSNTTSLERRSMYIGDIIPLDSTTFLVKNILDAVKNCGINSLFIEGGSNLLTQFITDDLWDRVTIYTAPKILGEGITAIGKLPITHPKDAISFHKSEFKILDNHMVFNGWKEEGDLCLQV